MAEKIPLKTVLISEKISVLQQTIIKSVTIAKIDSKKVKYQMQKNDGTAANLQELIPDLKTVARDSNARI